MTQFKKGWIDTHAHLDFYGSDGHVGEIVARAVEQGVSAIITASDTPKASEQAILIADRYDEVYAAVGVHPHEISLLNSKSIEDLYEMAKHEKVIAIGEIGLDYYRDTYPHSDQQRAFEIQLEIAKELDMPVVIHNREADHHVLSILEKINFDADKTVLHCFSADEETADEVIKRNYYVSLSGIVTFNNVSESVAAVIKKLPEDRILIETDSPFLPPHPYRGKTNEPSFLPLIGNKIAEIRGVDADYLCKKTRENANRLFFGE